MAKIWIDLLYYDEETGEEFFVELDTNNGQKTESELHQEAWTILEENFDEEDLASVSFQAFVSPEYAEAMGLDTY